MNIKIVNLVWIIFVVLSILMGGNIGRSYMWLASGSIILFLLIYRGKRGFSINKLIKQYNYFAIYCAINTIYYLIISGFKSNIYVKTQLIEMLVLAFAASYLTAYYMKTSDIIKFVKRISWLLMIAGVIEKITKFNITKYFGNSAYVERYLVKDGRVISIFSHPIGYAIVLTFFFLFALYYPYRSRNKQITYMIFIFINLMCTKTRMAMIAIMISVIIYVLKNRRFGEIFSGKIRYTKNSLVFLILIVLIGVVVIGMSYNKVALFMGSIIERIVQMFTGNEQGIRIGVIVNYFSGLGENSLFEIIFGKGTGYASYYMIKNPIYYWNEIGERVAWAETTDNMYITILMNYGIIGFLIFFNILVTAVKKVIFETDKNILMGCSGIIVLFFVMFFFEGLYWPIVMNVIGIYMVFITKKSCDLRLENSKK